MSKTVPEILEDAAATYRERNAIYKDNYKKVGAILAILHGPDSAHPMSSFAEDAATMTLFDLYRMAIGKLTRFAESGLTHVDSAHDACVYWAMVESLLPGVDPKPQQILVSAPANSPPRVGKVVNLDGVSFVICSVGDYEQSDIWNCTGIAQ